MRLKLFYTFLLGMAALFPAAAQNYVTVYVDCDYRGASHRLYEGDFRDNDLGVGNDKISALRIPRGWSVTVYTDNDFRGSSRTFDDNVACVPADLNDKISSIRVSRSGYSGGNSGGGYGAVTLFKDCNYRGSSHRLGVGTHNADDLGIGNDQLSSIRVPRGYMVTVYTDNYQRGYSHTFESDERCFSDNLNDKVSSLVVERTGGSEHMPSNRDYSRPSYSNDDGDVILYRDCDYRGASIRLGPGTYDDRDLGRIGNDQLSSLRIPRGYKVELFTDNNQRGTRAIMVIDTKCLPDYLNDKVSSLVISRL